MPKRLITLATLFVVTLMLSSQTSAYALIDLNPKSSAPALALAQDEEAVEIVEVSRKQKGHLLALVPVNFMVRVVARADGTLEIDYPWYSFMTLSHREELETKLKVAANNARWTAAVGSVRAEGTPSNPKFTAEEAEAVAEGLSRVLAEYGNEKGD